MDIVFYSSFACICFFALKFYIKIATKFNIVDKPDERRNHVGIVARGGGFVVLLCSVSFYFLYSNVFSWQITGLLLICLALSTIFFIEDIKGLSLKIRLVVQSVAVVFGIYLLRENIANVMLFIPFWLKVIAIFVGWIWYINLYNFMDGIDGITAMQTSSICVYILIILSFVSTHKYIEASSNIIDSEVVVSIDDSPTQNLLIAKQWTADNLINYSPFIKALLVAIAIFFYFNKTPAKIFIGDSGSIGLGFIMGALLIKFGCEYSILAAFCITMYYIADSTITVVWRIYDREKIWTPHLRHFFTKAKKSGLSAIKICIILTILNIILGCLGYFIVVYCYYRLFLIAFFCVGGVLLYFNK